MLKIQSLLNPTTSSGNVDGRDDTRSTTFNPPLTPALTSTTSNSSYSPRLGTPDTAFLVKRQKLIKDAPVFVKGEVRAKVHFAPFESNDDAIALPPWQRDELLQQHRRFNIYPSGSEKDGFISDFVKHIPYSSDKKDLFGKAGWEGFDVFQYIFVVPEDPTRKEHTVMWDYNNGLVRITPFFKACKYSKTTPAKALNANSGLKEMSHSVTGGALVAQGYWMPYSCARAICLTFAFPIRWALTPIFGPSFIRECLQPNHPEFARFRIDSETIRCAKMAFEGQKQQTDAPRSVPTDHTQAPHPSAGRTRPTFKLGSPFDSDSEVSTSSGKYRLATPSALNSPAISPKTTSFENSSGWTSINQLGGNPGSSTPSPPPNTPHGSLETSLLTEPPHASRHPAHTTETETSTATSGKRARRSSVDDDYSDATSDSAWTTSGSDASDDVNPEPCVYSKPAWGVQRNKGNAQNHPSPSMAASSRSTTKTPPLKKSKKYTTADYRAARLLLEVSGGL